VLLFSFSFCTSLCEYRCNDPCTQSQALMSECNSYGSCVDATTYVYATEIWPTHIRSKGSALATTGLFTSSLILQTVSPTVFENIQWRYYIVFMSLSLAAAAAFWVWWPEVSSHNISKSKTSTYSAWRRRDFLWKQSANFLMMR
jgi:MFS family permease